MKLPGSLQTIPAADGFGREGPPTKHLKEIGKVVVAGARLEETLGIGIILLLSSIPELVDSTLVSRMPFVERSIALRGICSYWLGSADKIRAGETLDDKEFKELEALFDRIDEAQARRNKVVHSCWSKRGLSSHLAHRYRWVGQVQWRKLGWSEMDYDVVSIQDLEEDAKFIEKVNFDLMRYIFSNRFGGLLQQYAADSKGRKRRKRV